MSVSFNPPDKTVVPGAQVFDSSRVGSSARALALVDRRLRTRLEAILRDLAELTGFRAASVARRREDGQMQMIAVVGTDISPAQMEEGTMPVDLWLEQLGSTGDWGRWKYTSGDDGSNEAIAHSWVPDLPVAQTEDDWDALAELACPLYDAGGRLIASLFLDAPIDGKVPPAERREHLNRVGSLAAQAVVAAIEDEESRLRLRLLNAAAAAAAATDRSDFDLLAEQSILAFGDSMQVDAIELVWLRPELNVGTTTPSAWLAEATAQGRARDLWDHDDVLRVSPRIDAEGTRHDGLLVVPIGTESECFGAVAALRRQVRAPWTRTEVRGVRDFAAQLGQAARAHLWRHEEQVVVDDLREKVAEHSQLAAGVRHDLAAPLSAIRNYLDLLTTAQDDPEMHGRILEALRVGTSQVHDVAEALSALGTDAPEGAPEHLDLGQLLDELHALHAVRASHAGVTFTLDRASGQMPVLARPDSVRRVLSNITINAVKYTPAGGRVAITATREARGEAMLRVVWQDTGIGIAEEEIPHVWDDFYRAPDERVRRRSGTGLGLPIVARLVEEMGGQVTLTSVLDAGTRVTLELPLRP